MSATTVPQLGTIQSASMYPAEIREDDRTNKFRFTDKHGNPGDVFLGADLFNLFSIPNAFFQQFSNQFNAELPRIVSAVKDWAKQWKDHIEGWELYPREEPGKNNIYFHFIVTQKGNEYDQILAEALGQFDSVLYNQLDCSLIRVTSLMVPDVTQEEIEKIWA